MPEKETLEKAREDARQGKAPSTQAGEFVREEIKHVREGTHGARSAKQAIAIGLSKARRAGVQLPPPGSRTTSAPTQRKAEQDTKAAEHPHKPARKRSRAAATALEHEKKTSASPRALSKQGRGASAARTQQQRSAAAKKAARTRKRHKSKT